MDGRTLVLVRETDDEAEFDIAMRATSDGQHVDFNVHVLMNKVEGMGENPYGVVAYPNPTEGQLTLSMEGDFGFDYHVYSLTGQCVMNGQVVGNEAHLDMGDLNKGVYFLSIEWDGKKWMRKVIVK